MVYSYTHLLHTLCPTHFTYVQFSPRNMELLDPNVHLSIGQENRLLAQTFYTILALLACELVLL